MSIVVFTAPMRSYVMISAAYIITWTRLTCCTKVRTIYLLSSAPRASCTSRSTILCFTSTEPVPLLFAILANDSYTLLMLNGFGFRNVKLCLFFASKATSPASPYLLYNVLRAALSRPQTFLRAFDIAEPPSPSSRSIYGGDMEFVASQTCVD